ncbi:MAG: putative toxin-antitoxin system toxin component, PIN family [Rubrobacteraceae bacterium]
MDPGVLVSAVLSPSGAPSKLVELWKGGEFEMVVPKALLGELESVLLRPKFGRYLTQDEALEYVSDFRKLAAMVSDPEVAPGLTPDPKDDYLVALARSSVVHFLVAGDPHLTRLPNPRPPILTPRAFLEMLKEQD